MKTLREMQDSLYAKAKTEKNAKFNTLMDKICRSDVLKEAWNLVYENRGSPGIDGESVKHVKEREEEFLKELQEELVNKTYRVESVRRVFIPKANGKQRPLGIPTVKDRIVQQAVKLIIEPIFEADFQNSSYGYRPNRNAKQASEEIRKYLNYGCTEIVDMDISSFFDNIDHRIMISLVKKRIRDSYVLHLIREWLRAGVVYEGETTYPTLGTPQGGVISPLLANIYLNEIDRFWEEEGKFTAKKYDAHLIRWADDSAPRRKWKGKHHAV
ncbi:MAG: group II intron reverse transcriptase/maturase [Thermoplasmataceae archaeon]